MHVVGSRTNGGVHGVTQPAPHATVPVGHTHEHVVVSKTNGAVHGAWQVPPHSTGAAVGHTHVQVVVLKTCPPVHAAEVQWWLQHTSVDAQQTVSHSGPWLAGALGPHSKQGPSPCAAR